MLKVYTKHMQRKTKIEKKVVITYHFKKPLRVKWFFEI